MTSISNIKEKLFSKSILIIILLLGIIFIAGEYKRTSDFGIFIQAGNNLKSSVNIYITPAENGLFYYYSPLFALLLSFFSFLPANCVAIIWKIISLFALYRILILLKLKLLSDAKLPGKFFAEKALILTCLSSAFLIYKNFHNVQMNIFILYCILESYLLIKSDKIILPCILLSVAINFKLLPVVVIPYLVYRKRFLHVFLILVFSAALLFLPVVFIGYEYNNELLMSWFNSVTPFQMKHVLDNQERGLHSISSLVSALFNYSTLLVTWITNIIRTALIILTLFFLRSLPFRKEKNSYSFYIELSYILWITPLVFPHQQTYAYIFMLPGIYYIITFLMMIHAERDRFLIEKKTGIFLLIYTIFFLIIVNLELILGTFRGFYWHYKTLTIASIFLLPLLFVVRKYSDKLFLNSGMN